MSLSLHSPSSSFLCSLLPKSTLGCVNGSFFLTLHFKSNRSFPVLRASSGSSSSVNTGSSTELDAVSTFSEIVPNIVIFNDFEKFPLTAATVTPSLLLGILSLLDTIFRNAVVMALADSTCSRLDNPELKLSCFVNKLCSSSSCSPSWSFCYSDFHWPYWARSHSGDPEIEAAIHREEDPGLALVAKAYNYIHKYGHKSKLMSATSYEFTTEEV
ncbi:hypothetical protein V6N13_074414 [Hibiscus sabdariffa]|uniref:Uncharacterized protein n=1 Tax=Hibiscus sabdariffa TaxID=183260 RepID=A0ABR2U8G0_9ROSI